jgi:folate-binding protein YgfZ
MMDMTQLSLHEVHGELNARFLEVNGMEAAGDYGDFPVEHRALRESVGVLDLSFRSRIVLTGEDRVRLLNGQVTNNIKDLPVGSGCYATLITNKGRLQSDANIYILANEILLDFEPGLTAAVTKRLEGYIIADDVQLVDAAPHYGLLTAQGPRAWEAIQQIELGLARPDKVFAWTSINEPTLGEIYCMNQPRLGTTGFDLFVPTAALAAVFDKLVGAARTAGGRACGWTALEIARIEAGIPRFGAEMDETNLPPEAGIADRAISYTKGCYIGQEVIARIRTYGQVAKALRGLRFADGVNPLPIKGDKLLVNGKEVGYVVSAIHSEALHANIGLGYVRREHNNIGTELLLKTSVGETTARIVELPFR